MAEACEADFDRKWRVVEGMVEIVVDEMNTPAVNPIGEETFFSSSPFFCQDIRRLREAHTPPVWILAGAKRNED